MLSIDLWHLADPKFVLSALMLADVLGVVRPLTLWLQRSPAHADVTQLSSVVNHVVEKLRFLSTRDPELVSNFTEGELKK